MSDYPEHEKLKKVHDESQAIGAFLDWLSENGHVICNLNEYDEYFPWYKSIEQILALYFDIDLNVLEQEKRDMLDSWREKQGL